MDKTWWWVIGALTTVQAPYWALVLVRALNA
jgi:hypothetical protein